MLVFLLEDNKPVLRLQENRLFNLSNHSIPSIVLENYLWLQYQGDNVLKTAFLIISCFI